MRRHCRSAVAKSTHGRFWDTRPPPAARLADPCRRISVPHRGALAREVATRRLILAAVVSVVPLDGMCGQEPDAAARSVRDGDRRRRRRDHWRHRRECRAWRRHRRGCRARRRPYLRSSKRADRPLPIRRVIRPEAKAVRRPPAIGAALCGGSALGLPFPARRAAPGEAIGREPEAGRERRYDAAPGGRGRPPEWNTRRMVELPELFVSESLHESV
jgi:hypothetical protein